MLGDNRLAYSGIICKASNNGMADALLYIIDKDEKENWSKYCSLWNTTDNCGREKSWVFTPHTLGYVRIVIGFISFVIK